MATSNDEPVDGEISERRAKTHFTQPQSAIEITKPYVEVLREQGFDVPDKLDETDYPDVG